MKKVAEFKGNNKPAKPRPDFPLTPHPSGRWCKKVRGRLVYFGKWDDPDGALVKWLQQKDYLLAGRTPPADPNGLTVHYLCNRFLTAKKYRVDSGEMTARSWQEYHQTFSKVLRMFGKSRQVSELTPADFGQLRAFFAKGRGLESLSSDVQRTRSLFKWAYESDLIDRPAKFGPDFRKPGKDAKRKERNTKPTRLFTADEIRGLLDVASVQMKAMILLGANAGFGNADCAALPKTALDLETGIVDFPRGKTGVDRRAVLWPETINALKSAIEARPTPQAATDAGLVFITRFGHPWVKFRASEKAPNGCRTDSVVLEFGKLLTELKIERQGVGFYSLRHVFETVASAAGDQPTVDRIMGHAGRDMGDHYRHWLKDETENERLKKVADHVRAWLYGTTKKDKLARKPKLKLVKEKIA